MLRREARQGFTLIETMIGIGIVGVLLVLGVPIFTTLIDNYRVSASANEMYLFLMTARSEAIKRNMDVYVAFATGNDWCVGMNVGATCDCNTSGSCDLRVMRATAPEQVTLSIAGYASNYFYFEGVHGMASTAGNMTFTNFSSSDFVRLTAGRMGSVKMCSTGIGGYTAC